MTDQSAPPTPPESGWTGAPATTPVERPGPMAGFHYADLWPRFLALLLDAVLLGIVTAALAPVWGPQVAVTGNSVAVNAQANAISALVGLVYFTFFWAWRGQTIGMMPFNMQVVGIADGQKIDVPRALLRYVGFIISVIPLFLGLIWAAWDPRKQGWHDKIAATVVIRPN